MASHFFWCEPMTLCLLLWQRVSCQRGGDGDIDVFLWLRHVTLLSIWFPAHRWYLNRKGERFISLQGEEGGSCLSERACWIKGVISPEGGIWEWVSLRQRSLSHYLCLCMLPGSPSFDSPLPLLHRVILSFSPSPSSRTYPLPHRAYHLVTLPSSFPCWLHCCPTGNGELRALEDGCYSNHTSDAARVQ